MTDEFYDGFLSMLLQMQSVPKSNVHLYCIQRYGGDVQWSCKFELDTAELKIAITKTAERPDEATALCFRDWQAMQHSGTAAIKPALLGYAHPAPSKKKLDDGMPF